MKSSTRTKKNQGFTIVELLIVIVVIGILAAITIVSYNGVQARARNAARVSDITELQKKIEVYAIENGSYPKTADNIYTGAPGVVRSDANCQVGSKQTDWIPGIDNLPQSTKNKGKGTTNIRGCYMYASDGNDYVLSAWNNTDGGPQTNTLYRRIGFREMSFMNDGRVYCNHREIGGTIDGAYAAINDYYKFSYTVSNITDCDETPPAGA